MITKMLEQINNIIEPNKENTISQIYRWIMLIAISIGLFPLMFRKQCWLFWLFDIISCSCFVMDYILRWMTCNIRSNKKRWTQYVIYPFTPMAIIDLLSILPTFNVLVPTFKTVRITRLLKIFRVIKIVRYVESLDIIYTVFKKQRNILCLVLSLTIFYIFITALVMFNEEKQINPETGEYIFRNFFDALYWATSTLTTVGYGDIVPVSDTGKGISILSSLVGIAIIALPSGIITAGYIEELQNRGKIKKGTYKERTS